MASEAPIINILTYRLPFELANQIYNEFQSRYKEATYLIENYKTYRSLKNDLEVIELFLSLSIFHRRIITNFDGAVKFYSTVTKKGDTDTIKIGNYNLTGQEKNRILAVVINYNKLLEQFYIPPIVMEYYETREFLRKLIVLKRSLENGNGQEEKGEENLPF